MNWNGAGTEEGDKRREREREREREVGGDKPDKMRRRGGGAIVLKHQNGRKQGHQPKGQERGNWQWIDCRLWRMNGNFRGKKMSMFRPRRD